MTQIRRDGGIYLSLTKTYKRLKAAVLNNKFFKRYVKDRNVRVNFSLAIALISSLVYVAFNAVSGLIYSNAWLIVVGIYYLLLAIISYKTLKIKTAPFDNEQYSRRVFRRCGVLILILDIPMTAMMIYASFGAFRTEYTPFFVTALIVYSVFSFISAIWGISLSRLTSSLRQRTAYTLRFVSAMISIFNVRIALFSSDADDIKLNIFLSAALSLTVMLLALFLIRSIDLNQ